jgi:medium-chain acyl-[acyl-carrier-protein] hydrolase
MHVRRETEVWWPYGAPNPASPVRLICFPYAGGGASLFRSWRRASAPALDVCPVQLPGREGRIREAPFRRMDVLSAAVVDRLRGRLIPPYAFFGYSMGALIAFEVARRLDEERLPLPATLFVAAAAPAHRARNKAPLHGLPADELKEALRSLRGTPDEVLEHPELMELMLPTLAADFEVCETFAPAAPVALRVPIVAFGGTDDASVPEEDLAAWADLTRAGFRSLRVAAGHFFLESHSAELLRHVTTALDPLPDTL